MEIKLYKFHIWSLVVPTRRSAFPNAISWEPDISQKNLGNFPSRAFGNILFPVPTQYRHSGLAVSRSRLRSGNIWEFPNASRIKSNKDLLLRNHICINYCQVMSNLVRFFDQKVCGRAMFTLSCKFVLRCKNL